jgi:capsular polysaccharide export protein
MNSIGSLKNQNILFLQGPMGTFFKKLSLSFQQKGATIYKIGFNMGDQFFAYQQTFIPFRDKPEHWKGFITHFLEEKKIDKIFLFGDCRFYQHTTIKVAKQKEVDIFVFEEGYLRPHHITLEKFGVNGFSQLPRDATFYHNLQPKPLPHIVHAHNSKTKMILSAILYYALSNLFKFKYPYYRHHRDFSALKEAFYGVRGLWRKGLYAITERGLHQKITQTLSKKYYFIPLQTHNDFQILQHSNYHSIEKFIIEVLESFAHYAPKNTYLIFKHHPVDRGRKNYKPFIKEQAHLFHIHHRVLTIHDIHLPSCIKHALATVTVNSTVGLTSIGANIPTLTLGEAVYNIEGLTNHHLTLHKFWNEYQAPNMTLYTKFKQHLINTTQLNGSFYGLMPHQLR